jgi:hypothetical protein
MFSAAVAARWIAITYLNFGMDSKGVLVEIGVMVATTGSVAVMVILLVLLDPGEVEYRQEFSWNSLLAVELFVYQLNAFWWQLRISRREQHMPLHEDDYEGDFREVLMGGQGSPATVGF